MNSRIRFFVLGCAALILAQQSPSFGQKQSFQLQGRILLTNFPAPLPTFSAGKNMGACAAQIPNPALSVGKKLELENVVVFLANIKPEKFPAAAVTIDIVNCLYKPRVTALLQGDTLVLRSMDAATHHARGYWHEFAPGWDRLVTKDLFRRDSSEVFNFVFRQKNTSAWEVMNQPGLLEIRSEIGEEWLRSHVLVMPHRYFAVTNASGEFAFHSLPAGKYDLILWHETLGVKRQLVEVSANAKNELLVNWEINKPASADSLSQAQK